MKVATSESHTLFLMQDGSVWSCGLGFCGILGHGSFEDHPEPRPIEALQHTRTIDIAVGVRHSIAISEKGQVFTWGSADMGQLGHGATTDMDIHENAFDPRSGGSFSYVSKPTVVMELFGKRVVARSAACCNFSSAILCEQGSIYSWGNNTDGQCGQGQRCADHKIFYADPHMQRTAMQSLIIPRKLETPATFQKLAAGGYHMLAIDQDGRLWSWGRGVWGPLGHGDQRTSYDAKLVDDLKYHICTDVVAGEAHTVCLTALYRLTMTGSPANTELSPFSLLGLPCGRVDRQMAARKAVTPPSTSLQLNAFASAPLLQLALPYRHEPGQPVVDPQRYTPAQLQSSILLVDRGLWEGQWLKLQTSDFDFGIKLSPAGAEVPSDGTGIVAPVLFASDKLWEEEDCKDKVCIFECPEEFQNETNPENLLQTILEYAIKCQQNDGYACIFILPEGMETFSIEGLAEGSAEAFAVRQVVLGMMSQEHGAVLKKHITQLVNVRIAEAPGGVPEEARAWEEKREDFTGKVYYENSATGDKRWAPPVVLPNTVATLMVVEEDTFMERLLGVLDLNPKGVVVCQQSYRPDVELIPLAENILDNLQVPIVMVTYEAGEELKSVASNGSEAIVSMEVQPYGGVCSWGNGSWGQLGLAEIENRQFLMPGQNVLTGEANEYVHRPHYVAHLHEHQVIGITCGTMHTAAVTLSGEVFTWGIAQGLGVRTEGMKSDVPMFVEQLEGLVKATNVYAGHRHTFVVGEMPYKSIV